MITCDTVLVQPPANNSTLFGYHVLETPYSEHHLFCHNTITQTERLNLKCRSFSPIRHCIIYRNDLILASEFCSEHQHSRVNKWNEQGYQHHISTDTPLLAGLSVWVWLFCLVQSIIDYYIQMYSTVPLLGKFIINQQSSFHIILLVRRVRDGVSVGVGVYLCKVEGEIK